MNTRRKSERNKSKRNGFSFARPSLTMMHCSINPMMIAMPPTPDPVDSRSLPRTASTPTIQTSKINQELNKITSAKILSKTSNKANAKCATSRNSMTWKTLLESSDTKSSRKNLKNIMETTALLALMTSKTESPTILLWLKINFCPRISFKPWINSTGD
jgi:hypothetical protein